MLVFLYFCIYNLKWPFNYSKSAKK